MTTLDLALSDEVLQDVYSPGMIRQLNDSLSPLYQLIAEPTAENLHYQGRKIIHGIHVGRNTSTGSRDEMDDLPEADHQKHDTIETGIKYHYLSIEYTGQVLRQAVQSPGAFVNRTTEETTRMITDIALEQCRQLYNDDNGSLATTDSIPVGQVQSIVFATNHRIWLLKGTKVDIGTVADPVAGASNVTIASYSAADSTITFKTGDDISGVISGHFIRKHNSYNATNQRTKERTGLKSFIHDTSTLHGLDPAVEPEWASYLGDVSGVLAESDIQILMDTVVINAGNLLPRAYTTHNIMRNFGNLMEVNKRYVGTLVLESGHTAITVSTGSGTMEMLADRFCPEGEVYAPDPTAFCRNQVAEWQWMQEDGSVLARLPNKDAYGGTYFCYEELTIKRRDSHARLVNVSEV